MSNSSPKLPTTSKNGGAKMHRFMSTPSFLKTKFMSVLGSSNDLINEISNRLEISMSHGSSTDTDTNNMPRDPRLSICGNEDDSSVDENVIDFESRKVKEQRAREELKSGCYRQPSFIKHVRRDDVDDGKDTLDHLRLDTLSVAAWPQKSLSSSPSSVANVEPRALGRANRGVASGGGSTTDTSPMREVYFRGGFTAASFEVTTISSQMSDGAVALKTGNKLPNSALMSSDTSENDASESTETSDPNHCMRTVSANSLPSLTSSLSLDGFKEEVFMKNFVDILFVDSATISLEHKSEFGDKARTEVGRLSFARLVSAKRGPCKKVSESTFYSLIQYFAIVLFECCEAEDYSPAKIVMNMCFTFYHNVDVPGCEPYREYLYTYLREQPVWQSLRFWNAAIFDALHCERVRSILPTVAVEDCRERTPTEAGAAAKAQITMRSNVESCDDDGDASSSGHSAADGGASGDGEDDDDDCGNSPESRSQCRRPLDRSAEEAKMHQNIVFGQLGTFTCNMHAFGLPRELCNDFLRKQCGIANLNRDQEKTLLDNVNRMYNETAKWRV